MPLKISARAMPESPQPRSAFSESSSSLFPLLSADYSRESGKMICPVATIVPGESVAPFRSIYVCLQYPPGSSPRGFWFGRTPRGHALPLCTSSTRSTAASSPFPYSEKPLYRGSFQGCSFQGCSQGEPPPSQGSPPQDCPFQTAPLPRPPRASCEAHIQPGAGPAYCFAAGVQSHAAASARLA